LGTQELKVLELIGKNSQGVTVKEISRLLQCVNSTANNLLIQLCDLNFLVRGREGRYGSYLYFLHPTFNLGLIQWALENQTYQNELGFNDSPSEEHLDYLNTKNDSNPESSLVEITNLIQDGLWHHQESFKKIKKAEDLLKKVHNR
jgi:hypothetical protein